MHVAAEVNAGRDVSVIANNVVVIDSTGGIEDHISSNDAAGVDDSTGADHAAQTKLCIRRHDRRWMPGDGKALARSPESIKEPLAGTVVANTDNDRVVRDPRNIGEAAQDRQPKPRLIADLWIVVEIPDRIDLHARLVRARQDVGDHLGMAAGAKNESVQHLDASSSKLFRRRLAGLANAIAPDDLPDG